MSATIMRSPSTQPPNTGEYAGPPMIWFTLCMSNRCSPGAARLAPGVMACACALIWKTSLGEFVGVVRVGINVHARAGRLHIPAHHVKALADHGASEAVARDRHRPQGLPGVRRRIVGLERAERGHHSGRLVFAAGDVQLAVVD